MAKGRKRGTSGAGRSRGTATAGRGRGRGGKGASRGDVAARGGVRPRGSTAAASRSTTNAQTSTRVTRQSAARAPNTWTAPDLNDDPEAILRRARRAAARNATAGQQNQQPAPLPPPPPPPPPPVQPPQPRPQAPQSQPDDGQQSDDEDVSQAHPDNDEPAVEIQPASAGETTVAAQPVADEQQAASEEQVGGATPAGTSNVDADAEPGPVDTDDSENAVRALNDSVENDPQSSSAKRPAKDEPEDSDATKKVKIDETGPCLDLATNLSKLKTEHASDLTGPVVAGEDVDLNVMFQALAAVTEAVNDTRGRLGQSTLFSLFHPQSMGANASSDTPVVYPRQEALVPIRRQGRNRTHCSLIAIRRVGEDRFALDHFDSNRSQRASFDRRMANGPTRSAIIDSGWTGEEDPNPEELLEHINTVYKISDHHEGHNWAVGIHVILNGWAFAFGWALTRDAQVDREDFYTRAADLINLAIRGHLDQATILAFFNCYGYIQPDQTALTMDGRFFINGTTTAFNTVADLERHVRTANGDVVESFRPAGPAVQRTEPDPVSSTRPDTSDNEAPAGPQPGTRLHDFMNLGVPLKKATSEERENAQAYLDSLDVNFDDTRSIDDEPADDDEEDEQQNDTQSAPATRRERYDWRGRLINPAQPRAHTPPSPLRPGNAFYWVPPSSRQPAEQQQPSTCEGNVQLDDPEDRDLFGEDDDEDLYSGTFGPRRTQAPAEDVTPTTPSLALPPLQPTQSASSPQQPAAPLPTPATPQASFGDLLPGITQQQQQPQEAAPTATMGTNPPYHAEEEAQSPPHDFDTTLTAEQREAEAEAEQAYTGDDFGQDVQDDQEDSVVAPGYGGQSGGNVESSLVRDPEDDAKY